MKRKLDLSIFIAVILGTLCFILGYYQMVPGVAGVFHDDGIYLCTAKAIAEGKGYRLINLPNSPIQTKYPFLYPLMISIIWYLYPEFPANLFYMQILNLSLSSLAVSLSYIYLIKHCRNEVAFISIIMCITSPIYLYFTTLILTEMPFAFFLILLMLILERTSNKLTTFQYLFLGILLSLPFLTRSVGIAFVLAGLLWLWRQGHKMMICTIGSLIMIFPWILWNIFSWQWNHDPILTYYTNYYKWYIEYGLLSLLKIFWTNLCLMLIYINPIYHLLEFQITKIPLVIYFILLIIGGAMIFLILKDLKNNKILPLFLIIYFGIILIWPWKPLRFLIPVLPFLYSYFWQDIWQAIRDRFSMSSNKVFFILSIIIIVIFNGQIYYENIKFKENNYPPIVKLHDVPKWKNFAELFDWIKENTSKDDILGCSLDTMLYLYTNRKSLRLYVLNPLMFYQKIDQPLGNKNNIYEIIKKYNIKYIILCPMYGFAEEEIYNNIIYKILKENTSLFKNVYSSFDREFMVYKVNIDKVNIE